MTPEFLNASVPKPYTVLGLPIHPISISHICFLRYFKSAYIEDRKPELEDLVMACLICAHDRQGLYEFLDRHDLAKELKRLGKGWKLEKLDNAFELFKSYLDEGTRVPQFEILGDSKSDTVPGAPWLQRLRVALMSRLHIPPEDAWNYPYALACADYYTYLESEQAIHIIGECDDADDMIAELKAKNAELEADLAKERGQNG